MRHALDARQQLFRVGRQRDEFFHPEMHRLHDEPDIGGGLVGHHEKARAGVLADQRPHRAEHVHRVGI